MLNASNTYNGGWDSWNLWQNNVLFAINIIAGIFHIYIWSQVFIQKIKIDLSFIFSAAYMCSDIFLVSCGLIVYAIRIQYWLPVTRWSCYFEVYSMFYFNLFESYCLAGLNICRYYQIARNQNIYVRHRRKIFFLSHHCYNIHISKFLHSRFIWLGYYCRTTRCKLHGDV